MHADPVGVLTGAHFIDGDHAACEGAIAAGARFAAGYPNYAFYGSCGALLASRSKGWRNFHSDGR